MNIESILSFEAPEIKGIELTLSTQESQKSSDKDPRRWALLDIETTGIRPEEDDIIDVGYLLFEGTTCIKQYQSLVRYEGKLSQFIQKLTGIKDKQLQKAPSWREVGDELKELIGCEIIAHNAAFEESFLGEFFNRHASNGEVTTFVDSMDFLGWMYPDRSSLSLEGFIQDFGLADKEMHRGFQDSVDLLKVMLAAKQDLKKTVEFDHLFNSLMYRYELGDNFWSWFWQLDEEQTTELADAIEFQADEIGDLPQAGEVQDLGGEQDSLHWDEELSFDGKSIKEIYRNTDKIREVFPDYHYRQGQEELSLRLGQSFKNGVHSLIQAPTGTGKTLGYLLPTALFTAQDNEQVLVATGTKALQSQAINKDVPALKKLLGNFAKDVKIQRLIGSSNHYCESTFRSLIDSDDLLADKTFESRFSQVFFEIVFFWNSIRPYEMKITRESTPSVFKRKYSAFYDLENSLAVDFRSCTGFRCPLKHGCSYIEGIKEARESHIIVGNHSLMFQWPKGLPRPLHIIVDEAHRLENEATSAFSLEVSQYALDHLRYQLNHLQGIGSLFYLLAQFENTPGDSTEKINELRIKALETGDMLKEHLGPLQDQIENYFKTKLRYTPQYWNEMPFDNIAQKQNTYSTAIYNHLDSIRHILDGLEKELIPIQARFDISQMDGDAQTTAFMRFDSFANTLTDIIVALNTVLGMQKGYSNVLKYKESDGFFLAACPIDVGRIMHDGLLETSTSVVFTSATLANASGNFGVRGIEWATGYSYLETERRFRTGLYLPNPFDYQNRARVFLCDDTPSIHDQSFVPYCLEKIYPTIEALEGRTLLLFSSRVRFENARELLLEKYDGKFPLFFQGMGQNVVEEFKRSRAGILVGMESFGEGIDIPGEQLQFLFIDKIPDLRMDLVIQDRRHFFEGQLGNEFTEYYLAHRARSLQQKLGRLLRREGDYGAAVIVDSRIKRWKGRTSEKFTELLRPYNVKRMTLEEAQEQASDFILNFNENNSSIASSIEEQPTF